FLVLSAPVLRQIARYLPHYRSENASKTHPKSSHDKFKTASEIQTESNHSSPCQNKKKYFCTEGDCFLFGDRNLTQMGWPRK
ncbi:hypothetical protein, partial [Phocaeicola sp.]|uniref:hypothetical protein n=1 Tax=Phocaeicola sp. TaxID=2773926 RepID=UPI00307BF51A